MAWQEVHSRFVRQDHSGLRAQWYWDGAGPGGGELMLWADRQGRLVAFQLSHEEWPSLKHYVAEWRAGAPVRVGEVDEGTPAGVRGIKPAPVMRFAPRGDAEAAGRLLRYFRENAAAVDPQHQRTIDALLGEAAA